MARCHHSAMAEEVVFKPLVPPAPPPPKYPPRLIYPNEPKPTSSLRIIFQNVNLWETNGCALRPAYSKVNADIILLADTGLGNDDKLKLHPYISYRTKNVDGTHAGVAILIRPEIKHRIIQKPFHQDMIAVQVETTTGPIIVATCYQPPRLGHPPFLDLDWLADHHLPTYLLADLNCHHESFPHHSVVSGEHKDRGDMFYEEWIEPHRLIRHGPSFPTFFNFTREGTAPDIVLSNTKIYHNHHISPLEANASDHLGIKFTISSKPIQKMVRNCENRKKADWEGYSAALAEDAKKPLVPSLRGCDAPTAVAALMEVQNSITANRMRFIPQVKVCTRPFVPTSPKFNRLTKVLNTLNYNYVMSPNPLTKLHISKQKTKVNISLREEGTRLMDEYWLELINEAASYLSTDPKMYWKKLLRLRGSKRTPIRVTHDGTPDGNLLFDDVSKEQSFRNQFAPRYAGTNEDKIAQESIEVMDRFFADHPGITEPYPTADFGRFDGQCPYSGLVTPPEVYSIIHHGSPDKAPAEDGTVKEHLRHIPKILLVRLAHIFSALLALGIFPDTMKCALIVFVHKPGKPKCDPANYRPISLLPVLGKIYDKVLTNRLSRFLEEKNLNHPHQYGFTRGRGTVSALAMSYEWIARQKARRHSKVTMVARDIKGAFDFLPHRRIEYHMARKQVPPMLMKALCDFLRRRFARVKIGSVIGPKFPVNSGSPQGAGPSSAAFNLSVSDSPLPPDINQYWSSYADDTSQLICTIQRSAQGHRHGFAVSRAVNTLNEFEHREGLITEPAKSWIMPIGNQKPPYVVVNDHEYKMPPDRVGKLLGHHFRWNSMVGEQASIQASRADSVLGTLWRYKRAKTKTKVHAIKTLLHPYLTYPCIPLHTASDSVMGKLQAVQNKALKFAFDVSWFDFISSERLHTRFKYKFKPLNQVLYWRAKKQWEKISSGSAADPTQYNVLVDKLKPQPDEPYHPNFPSSLEMVNGPEPPPLYTY